MKTSFKRLLSLVLVVLTLVGCASPIFAAETSTTTEREDPVPSCGHSDVEFHSLKEPTCTEWGYTTYWCNSCEDYVNGNFKKPENNHAYELKETVPATCTQDGYKKEVCTKCGDEKVTPLYATNHKGTLKYPADFDCTVGTDKAECTKCNAKNIKVDALSEHKWEPVVNSQCTSAGDYECKNPGCTKTKTDASGVGHEFVLVSEHTPAVCQKGEATYKCNNCDFTYVVEIAATHNYKVDPTLKKPATCTEEGRENMEKCTLCGDVNENSGDVIKPLNHDFKKTDPKPTIDGYCSIEECSRCDATRNPVAHKYTWTVTTDATCTTKGEKKGTCSVCSHVKKEAIDETHSDPEYLGTEEPTCTKWGYDIYVCRDCGAVYNVSNKDDVTQKPLGHKFVDTKGTPATCTTSGSTAGSICERCATPNPDTKTETIPAFNHKVDGVSQYVVKKESTCKPGDFGYEECKLCGHQKPLALADHKYETKTTKLPTCKDKGETREFCKVCGKENPDTSTIGEIAVDKVNGHKIDESTLTVYQNPTCDFEYYDSKTDTWYGVSGKGYGKAFCSLCGEERTVEIPAKEHKAEAGYERVVFQDCTTKIVEYKCVHRDYDEEAHFYTVKTTIDDHNKVTIKGTPAGCTTTGTRDKLHCTKCDWVDEDMDGGKIDTLHQQRIYSLTAEKTADDAANKIKYNKAVAVTCTTDGSKAYIQCTECSACFVWNGTKYVDAVNDFAPASPEAGKVYIKLRAPGHKEQKFEKYEPHCPGTLKGTCVACDAGTCTGAGRTAGKKCSVCNEVLEGLTAIAPATGSVNGHSGYKVTPATCCTPKIWSCTVCGQSGMLADPTGAHTVTTKVAQIVKEGKCTPVKFTVEYCSVCADYIKFNDCDPYDAKFYQAKAYSYIEAVDHMNSNGVVLVEGWYCTNDAFKDDKGNSIFTTWKDEDFDCAECNKNFPVNHEKATIKEHHDANCISPEYIITVCASCQWEGTDIISADFDKTNHVDTDIEENEIEKKDPDFFNEGYVKKEVVKTCPVHGVISKETITTPIAKLTAFEVRIEVVGDTFVKSGILEVKVILKNVSDQAIPVQGAQVSFPVTGNLIYRGVEFTPVEGFEKSFAKVEASINNGEAIFVMNTYKDADGKNQEMVIPAGKEVSVATLEFIISDYDRKTLDDKDMDDTFTLGVPSATVIQKVGSNYTVKSTGADITKTITLLGDVNMDGVVNVTDAQVLANLLENAETFVGEYNKALDVDKSGDITIADLAHIQRYITGYYDAMKFYNLGLEENEVWGTK